MGLLTQTRYQERADGSVVRIDRQRLSGREMVVLQDQRSLAEVNPSDIRPYAGQNSNNDFNGIIEGEIVGEVLENGNVNLRKGGVRVHIMSGEEARDCANLREAQSLQKMYGSRPTSAATFLNPEVREFIKIAEAAGYSSGVIRCGVNGLDRGGCDGWEIRDAQDAIDHLPRLNGAFS